MKGDQKVALVHDFLTAWGGAERVLLELSLMYPEAPIYTLYADSEIVERYLPEKKIHQSFLRNVPQFLKKRPWWLLPFFPIAIEAFDLRDYTLVISSSGAWSKGVVTRLHTKHVAYLHSPMRFVWDSFHWYPLLRRKRYIMRRFLLSYLRLWDKEAAARPDVLIANSQYTRERIAKYYRRDSTVIYPPLTLQVEQHEVQREYFLVVSRLTAAKGIDVVIEVCNKLSLPLRIVGAGRELSRLQKIAGSTVTFEGSVDDTKLSTLYRGALALIQAQAEDFGLAMIESLAHATPVIALSQGGAKEFIESGKTGELFFASTPEVLADAIRRFLDHKNSYNTQLMLEVARRFSSSVFREQMSASTTDVTPE